MFWLHYCLAKNVSNTNEKVKTIPVKKPDSVMPPPEKKQNYTTNYGPLRENKRMSVHATSSLYSKYPYGYDNISYDTGSHHSSNHCYDSGSNHCSSFGDSGGGCGGDSGGCCE